MLRKISSREALLEDMEDFIENSGHKNISVCMNFDKSFQNMMSNNIVIFLQDKIEEMEELLKIGKITTE